MSRSMIDREDIKVEMQREGGQYRIRVSSPFAISNLGDRVVLYFELSENPPDDMDMFRNQVYMAVREAKLGGGFKDKDCTGPFEWPEPYRELYVHTLLRLLNPHVMNRLKEEVRIIKQND